jgi:putative phosphoesterase
LKIAVIGDTHGRIEKICRELKLVKADQIFFTGDFLSDAKRIAHHLGGVMLHAVAGNCDFYESGPAERILDLEGKRFYMVHGHQYGVKISVNSLYYRGLELGADVVLFGHTHIPFCKQIEGIWLINPGSPSRPRLDKKGSYALLYLEKGKIEAAIEYI